ncbi:anti-anti-sigma factor [Nocardia transvalensis]|uniref:Anti-anti-sigma factor n=1 Tax=Nocardia transvalensis TaxID=37333 RepID=A0A7W9PKP7_9NOCA|nr:STAS domain-containing protein [Nocardia transvalensis]MBB5917288.1 anti-anti-sigma factor [Nocardia transvalensis]
MSAIAVMQRPIDAVPAAEWPPPAPVRDWRRRCTIVRVEGELDAAMAGVFRQALGRAVAASSRAVVLDLRHTRFLGIGSSRLLAEAKCLAGETGVDLRVVAGGPEVERVLTITGVRPLFRWYDTVQDALDA